MIVTKTPFRISLLGGGSDLETFYAKSPGACLSFSINKYMYISTHQYFEKDQYRLKYSKTETVTQVNEIQHPILREALKVTNSPSGVELSSIADIPAGTGMGSSSSFTVGVLQNLFTRKNQFADKYKLAEMACDIEINRLKEPIGKQDQYAASFGGLNIFRFLSHGAVNVETLNLSSEAFSELQKHMVLFYTGTVRSASEVLSDQKQNIASAEDKFNNLKQMVSLVDQGRKLLVENNFKQFAGLIHESWLLKKSLSAKISNGQIDEVYNLAMKNGAWGGKLLGAGGGGFLLFFTPPENRQKLIDSIKLREYPFKIEFDGSKVIYYEEE